MEAQTRLLRVLQQGEYTTVGGRVPIKTNVRIIAATNKDLRHLDPAGPVPRGPVLPHQRGAPAPAALAGAGRGHPGPRAPLLHPDREGGPAAQAARRGRHGKLKRYSWPGNVRELENLVRRLAALYPQDTITGPIMEAELDTGPAPTAPQGTTATGDEDGLSAAVERHLADYFGTFKGVLPPPGLYHRVLREIEGPLIGAALAATRGNQIRAAELLGVNRNTLRKKVRGLDLQVIRSAR
jgi:two-component system nitrogen regulation response regulator GlnG